MHFSTSRDRSPLIKTVEVIVIFFAVSLVNINSLIRFRQFPEVKNYSDHEGDYILVAIVTVAMIALLLWKHRLLAAYLSAWKHNIPLLLFLAYAVASLAWSVYTPATQYKLFFLFFSTIAGAYLAIRYRARGILNILTWIAAICAILSILLVAFFPFVGIMLNQLFFGSWNGMFWHRNHTGNIFAFFSVILLFRILLDDETSGRRKLILVLLYLLCALMVVGSRSATGYIVFLFLHFVLGLIVIWLKFHERIKPWHYAASAATMLAAFLVFITNTGFFFGLLGRSASMTGRVPVWKDLFYTFYLHRPIFGYGYGALWMQRNFRLLMEVRHNWTNQVYFADNGFFDILLNTGVIGLLLFLAVYLPMGLRGLRQAITTKHWLAFFPVLTFLYIFAGNLTYSFLLEVDQFVWMLLVIMVFLTTSASTRRTAQP